MRRSKWLATAGLVLIAGMIAPLLAGCGPTPTTVAPATKPPQPTATPAPPPTATPVPTPVVVHLNLGSEPPTLDPALATDLTSIDVIQQLFLGLTGLKPETGEVIPRLATSWDISPDGLVYTFHMRNDAYWVRYDPATDTFEKIRPVTAYDVEYGVRRTVMPETASDYAYVLYVLKNAKAINTTQVPTQTYNIEDLGVKALDDYTVQFTLEYPAGYFPAIAGMWVSRPQPKESIEEFGAEWTEPGNIMTNAAYALKEWTHDSHMTLVKNPYFYDAAKVQIDVIDYVMITEASTAFAMYENGELDSAGVPLDDLDRVKSDPVLSKELHIAPYPCTYYYGFTIPKPPVDNVHVRRALSHAIDRQGLIDNVLKGGQLPAHTFACPGIFGAPVDDMSVGIFYDPDKAKQEMEEAGYPGGAGWPAVTLMYNTSEAHARIAQAIQQMWKETLGIDVSVENMEWKVYLKTLSDGPVEVMPHIWRLAWCADYPDENNWVHEVFNTEEGSNRIRMSRDDPQVGNFVKEFDETTMAAAREADPNKRIELYKRAEHLLVYEIAGIAPIYYYTTVAVTKPYLKRSYALLGGEWIEQWTMEPH